MLGGLVVGEGASQSNSAPPTTTFNLPSTVGTGGQEFTDPEEGRADGSGEGASDSPQDQQQDAAAQAEAARQQREQAQLEQISREIRQALNALPQTKILQDSLVLDNTPAGLRIQIVDQERLPMFPPGSSALYEHTQKLCFLSAAS